MHPPLPWRWVLKCFGNAVRTVFGGRCIFRDVLLNISFPLCIFLWKKLTSFWFLLSFQELTHAWIWGSDLNTALQVLTQFRVRKRKVIYCRKDGGCRWGRRIGKPEAFPGSSSPEFWCLLKDKNTATVGRTQALATVTWFIPKHGKHHAVC